MQQRGGDREGREAQQVHGGACGDRDRGAAHRLDVRAPESGVPQRDAGQLSSVRGREHLRTGRRRPAEHHPRGRRPGDHMVRLQRRAHRAAQRERPLHGAAQQIGRQVPAGQDPRELPLGDEHARGRGLLPTLQGGADRHGELRRMPRPRRAQSDRRDGPNLRVRGRARCDDARRWTGGGWALGTSARGARRGQHGGGAQREHRGPVAGQEAFHAPTLVRRREHGNAPACSCGQTGAVEERPRALSRGRAPSAR